MNFEFLILGGYGQFVWPAFIFTFVSCFSLYVKTKKEFQKQEQIFLKEFKQMQTEKIEKKTVIQMNNYLKDEIKLNDFFVCYHDDHNNCKCRKPKSGLLLDAGKKWDINLKKSYMIGDRWKDIEAGKSAGCKTIFIDCNYKEAKPKNTNFTTDSLLNSVHIIENNIV